MQCGGRARALVKYRPPADARPTKLAVRPGLYMVHLWRTAVRIATWCSSTCRMTTFATHSLDFRAACDRLGIAHWRTKPYTPRTNGKAERFIKTLQERWAYARLYRSSSERAAALPDFLSEYRHRRSPTLDGHTPLCRFFGVNNLSGNHN